MQALVWAVMAPLRRPGAALRATLAIAALPVLVNIAIQALTGTMLAQHYVYDGPGIDPVLLQVAIFLANMPEFMVLLAIATLVLLGPWSFAIWWRGLDGLGGWRVPIKVVGQVLALCLLAFIPLVAESLRLVFGPVLSEVAEIGIFALAGVVSMSLFLKLSHRFRSVLGGGSAGVPVAWGRAVILSCGVLVFGMLVQIAALFLWMGLGAMTSAIVANEYWDAPHWLIVVLLMDWEAILLTIARLYAMLVLVALMWRLSEAPSEETASAA